jgi:hypothetical protein
MTSGLEPFLLDFLAISGEEDRQNQQRGGEAVVAGNKMGFGGESGPERLVVSSSGFYTNRLHLACDHRRGGPPEPAAS